MAADMGGGGHATVVLLFPGWNWHSYTGAAPAALVAIDRQVYFPGEVSKGFRFEVEVSPGSHELTVILGGNSRTETIEVELSPEERDELLQCLLITARGGEAMTKCWRICCSATRRRSYWGSL